MVEEIKRVLGPRVPWAFFIREEDIPQVGPLLYSEIKGDSPYSTLRCHIGAVNSDSPQGQSPFKELEKIYNDTLARNLIFLDELKRVLKVLNENKIEVILLKGIALIVEGVYPDPALRPMTDIDLLVHAGDFYPTKKILNKMGYDDANLGPEDFVREVNGIPIDIDVHTSLINITRLPSRAKACDINTEELWKHAKKITTGGIEASVLAPRDFIIDLAIHLAIHHGMEGLLWFLDIIYFLEYHKEMDWNEVAEYSRKCRADKFLYYALRYINEVLRVDVSKDIIERLHPKKIGFMEEKIFKKVLNGSVNPNAKFFFAFSSIDGIMDKLLFLKEAVFPPLKFLQARYNTKGSFYPYLVHFGDIIKKFII